MGTEKVDVVNYGIRYNFMRVKLHVVRIYKWKSPFLESLAPHELRMPILTHERCNMTYHDGYVYIVGCTDLRRCFFMKRLTTFTDDEWRLLNSS
ncbi:hypothetical protein ANCCAN_20841 [Ancylostoma caninum]|uniref:Kelch repeat protein n=1 Tax=Ancylostoma caninum TaxID=29170 RepID=A0A368FR70_ANCCA|nr:hypothetical protein ANCCAN_20841 [Ancylostoma caninum]